MTNAKAYDVVVVGAGPGGLEAALIAAQNGAKVCLVDENQAEGGQIFRASILGKHPDVAATVDRLRQLKVEILLETAVVDAPFSGQLTLANNGRCWQIRYKSLVLAVGARELFLPYPGWTLPNVFGIGGLQALVKSGLEVQGKRVVLAGTGPLLMAVGAYLVDHGAKVARIAEQAELSSLAKFLFQLMRFPAKVIQGSSLLPKIVATYRLRSWIEQVQQNGTTLRVSVRNRSGLKEIECDFVGCSFGFEPSIELPMVLGCAIKGGFVQVDNRQQTSVPGIFCIGEPTGIGGVDKAVVEGRIAGLASTSCDYKVELPLRAKWVAFAEAMEVAFRPRQELRELARSETIVCRCEDVTLGQLAEWGSSRAAKLQTRCGMGVCQGRICGPATRFLMDWEHGSVRPPISPIPLIGLAEEINFEKE